MRTSEAATSDAITRIAICAGSGASVLGGVRADLWLTGELSHHEVLGAVSSQSSVILCEHSNSERGYLHDVLRQRLQDAMREEGWAGEVICSEVDADPLSILM